jgi:hypothetical protein
MAASCANGGDGDEAASKSNDTQPKSEGTASQRAIEPGAQARAESMLLKLSDLPDGWRGSAPDEDDETGDDDFPRCLGADYSRFTIIGEATSNDFAMGESTEVSSDASVLEDEAQAQDSLEEFADAMGSRQAAECFENLFEDALEGESYVPGDVEVGELSFSPPADVDEGRAWQVVLPLEPTSSDGISVTAYMDVTYLRKDDALASVETLDSFSPFDAELKSDLVRAVAGRM